ncbi:MAG: FAD-dependent oxidoreductase, partial [Candidatus Paceibacterota bacterium]
RKQAIKFGTNVISETVITVDMKSETNKYFTVTTGNKSVYLANSIIIATGSTAKKLSFPGSDTYWMKGISACAVCDGALPMFKNQPLAVIGGGDTAMEEATFLSKFGSMVYIIHRSGKLRASKIMQERVFANPKIKILYNYEVIEASSSTGITKLEEITIMDNTNKNNTNNQTKIKVAGLFYAIGHKPASDFLAGQVTLDTEGYILTEPGTPRTSVPGLFAAGDVQDHKWRQAITAAASGCMAALEAEHYLGSM